MSSLRDITWLMSMRLREGSIGSTSIGVCLGIFPYEGFTMFRFLTSVGSFALLDFDGTPHFLGCDVQLGGPPLP